LNHVAERFGLRRYIELGTRVVAAEFDEVDDSWLIRTEHGEQVSATYCVMATGCLSAPYTPEIPGRSAFAGRMVHTARWPAEQIDFTGERVAVIGTGSSGIQVIPEIAQQAARLTVFQRTSNFSVPARNAPLSAEDQAEVKGHYAHHRQLARESIFGLEFPLTEHAMHAALAVTPEQRVAEYQAWWARGGIGILTAFADLLVDREANDTASEFARSKIRQAVHDPDLAQRLSPTGYAFGTKRLCLDHGYYSTFNRPNVALVDLSSTAIERITQNGIHTSDRSYDLDSIVFATGFDSMTGALLAMDIRGKSGVSLREKWADGPRTYLGIAVAGFPNLFVVTGPGSPSVLSNMVVSIEQHVDWITECISYLRDHAALRIEPTDEAEEN
jgi:cyclohexanone monooxygenase